jgi:predicted O-methyltransferase YrrM
MDLKKIKQHWEKWAQEFETDLRATTKTPTIKQLEIDAIYRAIKKTHFFDTKDAKILEVGCGNGYNCFALSELLPDFNFTGVDYVPEMIENAKKIQNKASLKYSPITFKVTDVLNLVSEKELKSRYDIIFTDRCIINLNTPELQIKAFEQLSKKVSKDGYLIILENFVQNYKRQNDCRKSVGLPERIPAEYNLFIDENTFLLKMKERMKLIHSDDFGSLHDILLYVLVPMINMGEIDYEHPLVKAATELSVSILEKYDNPFGSFGQNRLFLFRKMEE